jgi:TolB-like protein/tRNA A-37 threonylcarbamoyl transferase component Bud32/Tfp pilus assembly protein PilF
MRHRQLGESPSCLMTDLRNDLQAELGASYTVERELGGGGMSRVFLAEEAALGRRVVVKVLPPDLSTGVNVDRFRREVRLAAQLQHPHIVPLLTAGDAGGTLYYTTPFIAGETLRQRLTRERQLSTADAVRLTCEIAEALAYAHSQGVVHRDVKPENVLLSDGHALLTDFGIAKAIEHARGNTLTVTGLAIGTPQYMAPEQAEGAGEIDGRADVYALGCLLYELLVGQPAFTGSTAQAIVAQHFAAPFPHVNHSRPDVPPGVDRAIQRATAKSPLDRWATASEFAQSLREGAEPPRLDVFGPATGGSQYRRGSRILVLGLVVVSLVAVAGFVVWPRMHATKASIAVVPFVSLNHAAEDLPFGEGMAMEITDVLGRIPGLNVKAASLSREASVREPDPQRTGQLLHVASLLQGTIQRSGDRVHVSAQLVSVADGFSQWTGKYDFDFKDVFAVQDTIARAIAAELRVKLGAPQQSQLARAATTNADAHALYLRGMYVWNRRTGPDLKRAIELFEEAVAKDPRYVQAEAGIAMAYVVLPIQTDFPADSAIRAGARAAAAALAIDSLSAEAHAALGFANFVMNRNAFAERELRRAVALDSAFDTAHEWLGMLLAHTGHPDEAIREGRRSMELDPLSRVDMIVLGTSLYQAGRFADAEREFRDVIAFDSMYLSSYRSMVFPLAAQNRAREAVAYEVKGLVRASARISLNVSELALAYAEAGQKDEAMKLLTELLDAGRHPRPRAAGIALVYEALGDRQSAVRWLERAVDGHDVLLLNFSRGRIFDGLRGDSRGAALLAKSESPNENLAPITGR